MNRIKDLRIAQGMSQAQLGKVLNLSDVAVSRYETGARGLDVETIHKLCDLFDCTADYLLGRSSLVSNDLSEEETELVLAFRNADARSREIVRLTLAPFTAKATDAESGT